MKIAVPTAEGLLCAHFGHCQYFTVVDIDPQTRKIIKSEIHTPPPHEPGVFPAWLGRMGCTAVIAGGMGGRAVGMFRQNGIEVIMGAPCGKPEEVVMAYLNGNLATGANPCDDPGFHQGGHDGCGQK